MMIMPANNTSGLCHYLAGAHPGKIGLLVSPGGWRNPPYYFPWAIDNGAFTGFDPDLFRLCLRRATLIDKPPIWVAVPDVVSNAEATLKMWHDWHHQIDFPLAFVAQDGCEPQDVPKQAFAVFVGGSTEWKLANAHRFKGVSTWLHIGRVNTMSRLIWADQCGADSVDGTGYFRGNKAQKQALIDFVTGGKQLEFNFGIPCGNRVGESKCRTLRPGGVPI